MEKVPSVRWCGICGCSHHVNDSLCLMHTNEVSPVTTGEYEYDDLIQHIGRDHDIISIVVTIKGKLYFIHARNRKGTTTRMNVAARIGTAVAEALLYLRHGFKQVVRNDYDEKRR